MFLRFPPAIPWSGRPHLLAVVCSQVGPPLPQWSAGRGGGSSCLALLALALLPALPWSGGPYPLAVVCSLVGPPLQQWSADSGGVYFHLLFIVSCEPEFLSVLIGANRFSSSFV